MNEEPIVLWTITTPRPTTAGGATITNGVTTSTSGFGWPKLEPTLKAVLAQFNPGVRDAIEDAITLQVWIKIDAMPTVQGPGQD